MLQYKTHSQKLNLIKNGKLSLTENVEYFRDSINKNADLNAFNFVFEEVVEESRKIEEKIHDGKYGKLAGMVIAVKDVLALKDKPLTCSSNILKKFKSIYTATAVQKLLDEDALIIGKTNCDEFAMGSSNENSARGVVKNPVNTEFVPGGSSGGSAAAVAAGLCDASLGTDTGGSIRQPASFCGIYGFKPTYGRVSRFGLTAFASSFDTIGPFARSVDDISLLLQVISGKDKYDSTSSDKEVPDFLSEYQNATKLKIGLPQEFFSDGLDPEIRDILYDYISKLKTDGFEIIDIHLPHHEYSIAAYYILTTAEASTNLARYDGVRYTTRSGKKDDLINMYTNTRSEGFGDEVKRRIMLGTYVLSAGYYDAYYAKAQKVRRLIQKDFFDAFEKVDVIITPTSPFTAFKLGEKTSDPLQMYLSDIYTTSANLAGIPGINVPVGSAGNGLPIGMQILANQFEELKLLRLSSYIESNYLKNEVV
ncbi:MAG: Asp-tRNA(Asn)/Glu-tRNA(Gln) amidotransferase subunit GatA [Melioribacteraceae bacterium]|nr:Asp-tRNA(Asn)/Glu-tRNA(Gln) amidotransferase subunit GatA [Melioribacteraceae bacterium]